VSSFLLDSFAAHKTLLQESLEQYRASMSFYEKGYEMCRRQTAAYKKVAGLENVLKFFSLEEIPSPNEFSGLISFAHEIESEVEIPIEQWTCLIARGKNELWRSQLEFLYAGASGVELLSRLMKLSVIRVLDRESVAQSYAEPVAKAPNVRVQAPKKKKNRCRNRRKAVVLEEEMAACSLRERVVSRKTAPVPAVKATALSVLAQGAPFIFAPRVRRWFTLKNRGEAGADVRFHTVAERVMRYVLKNAPERTWHSKTTGRDNPHVSCVGTMQISEQPKLMGYYALCLDETGAIYHYGFIPKPQKELIRRFAQEESFFSELDDIETEGVEESQERVDSPIQDRFRERVQGNMVSIFDSKEQIEYTLGFSSAVKV